MPRRTEVIVVCEDALHRSFATAFLRRVGLGLRMPPAVQMQGSRSVLLNSAPTWINAVRTRGGEAHLIFLVDLDTVELSYIEQEIAKRLTAAKMPALTPRDNVTVIGAKREVDTWATFLAGAAVDEVVKFPVEDENGKEAGAALADRCRAGTLPNNAPPSLPAACARWQAYRATKGI